MTAATPLPSSFALDEVDRRTRALVTPEGVDLRVRIGDVGQRAAAFLIDACIIVGALVGFTLLCLLAGFATVSHETQVSVIAIAWLLGFFLLRNFYFTGFELGPRAATPGKRALGLRVAARDGGRLTADAVFARNAMREIETYLPLSFMLAPGATGVDSWLVLLGLLWTGVFLLFPLFNRDRLRVGDFVAGTWVVLNPRVRLVRDIAETQPQRPERFAFNPAQLDAYGIKELQVLEGVLRQNATTSVTAVAERIRVKIGWERAASESDWDFLDAYYAALRRRLEQQMLLGRRRKDKHDRG